jgi:hypothetical protein
MFVRNPRGRHSMTIASASHSARPIHRILGPFFRLLERHHRRVVLILMLGASIAGIGYVIWLGDVIRFPDERIYLILANHLAFQHMFSEDGVTPTTGVSPGWPLFLAPWVRLGLRVTGLHLLTMLLFVATLWATWRFVVRAAGPSAGTLTVLLLLAYPVLFFTGTTLYAQTFGTLLFLLGLVLIAGAEPRSAWPYVVAGLLYGWLVLAIPMFLPSILVVAAWRLWPPSRPKVFGVTVFLVMVGLVVGLWIARNYAQTGRFIFVANYSQQVFLIGNSALATPSGGGNTDMRAFDSVASRMSETERQQYYGQEALRWVTGHPRQAIGLYFSKVLYWFSPTNRLVQANQQTAGRDLVMILTYCPLLLLFVVRLLRFRRYPLQSWEVLFYLLYLQSSLCYAVFFPRIRYRLPYDYLLIGVVAGYIWTGWSFYYRRAAAENRVESLNPSRSPSPG